MQKLRRDFWAACKRCLLFGQKSLPHGLPLWLSWKRICLQCGRPRIDPWVGKIPWRSERLPTPVFWPGEFHGLHRVRKVPDTTEGLSLSLSGISTLVHYLQLDYFGQQISQAPIFTCLLCPWKPCSRFVAKITCSQIPIISSAPD